MGTVNEIVAAGYLKYRQGVGGVRERRDEADGKGYDATKTTAACDRQLTTGRYFRVGLKRK